MMKKKFTVTACLLLGVASLVSTGCTSNLSLGFLAVPIPVSPYSMDKLEDKFHEHERYDRVPILGPFTPGGPQVALDPPSDDQVMRVLERSHPVEGGLPMLHEVQRSNVRIVKEKIADYVDDPRVMPMIGPVQLHHVHYKCTVYFTEVTHVGWPLPHTLTDEDSVEVVYIDKSHLHMVGNVDPGLSTNY